MARGGRDDEIGDAGGPPDAAPREAAAIEAIGRRAAAAIPLWPIERLTNGGREAHIRHAGATYVLRITSNGKLILTK
jgi:hemin uptake protein HemP